MRSIRTPVLVLLALLLVSCGQKVLPPVSEATKSIESKAALETRAMNGDKSAQFELGAIYHDGDGVAKDLKKAKQWFEKSAAAGDERAQFNLGVMYYTGEGIKQDYQRAQQWFQKSVDQGNARAQFNLGVMEYRGEGMKQDFGKALNLFTKAATQNFAEAQFNLGVMEAKGEGKQSDIARAYAWFSLARDNGNTKTDEIIKNIERELKPDELTLVKKLASDLKDEIIANVKAAANAQLK